MVYNSMICNNQLMWSENEWKVIRNRSHGQEHDEIALQVGIQRLSRFVTCNSYSELNALYSSTVN